LQSDHYASPTSPKPLNYTKVDNISQSDSIKALSEKSNSHSSLSSSSSNVDIIKLVTSQGSNFVRDYYQSSHLNTEESINQIIKSPPPIPHQHFHKRYLRETLKQQDEEKRQQQQQEQQLQLQSTQLSSYIIAKPQGGESRYIFSEEHAIANYHNNNNNNSSTQSNYESNCEYDLSQKAIDYAMPKLNSTASSVASSLSSSPSPKQQQKQHPNNIPYDPLVHTTSKPPYSFR
jgi:DNA primase